MRSFTPIVHERVVPHHNAVEDFMDSRYRRGVLAGVSGLALTLAFALPFTNTGALHVNVVGVHPTVSDYVQVNASETPPTNAQCMSVGRTCFGPAATRASY